MSHEAKFVLPLPPTVNKAYPTARNSNRRIASKDLKQFKHDAHYILHEQGVASPVWATAKRLGLEATFYMVTRGSDLTNRIKALEDSLGETLAFNDNKVYETHFYKDIDRDCPRAEVRLWIVEEAHE